VLQSKAEASLRVSHANVPLCRIHAEAEAMPSITARRTRPAVFLVFGMAKRRGRLLGRHTFKLGDVSPADDKMSTYVVRLSRALGDLRIVADYATRARQSEGERLYFVRLFALHMREVADLLDPPDRTIIPTVDEFLADDPSRHETVENPYASFRP
jgi:hypothetical protein